MGDATRGRPVCSQCGSRRFRLVASQLVCSSGHVQRGFRVESAHDDDGFDAHVSTRTRAVHRSAQRAAEQEERRRRRRLQRRAVVGRIGLVAPGSRAHAELESPDDLLLSGARATFVVLQSLQLLLRLQLEAVHEIYGSEVSAQLEATAREIWALYLSAHPELPAEPLNAACAAARERGMRAETPQPRRAELGSPHASSSSDEEGDAQADARSSRVSLRSTVATLYLALVICRMPVTLGDLRKHIASRALPYLNALNVLPAALTGALSSHEIQYSSLDCQHIPSVMALHERAVYMARVLQLRFGVVIPELNAVPVLSRMTADMLLPPTFYVAAKSLLTFLRIDMHVRSETAWYPAAAGNAHAARRERDGGPLAYSRNASVPRCIMLMGALLVIVKLRWGLDGLARRDSGDTLGGRRVVSGAPEQDRWLGALLAAVGLPGAPTKAASAPPTPFCPWDPDTDLLGLSDEQIDQYLGFIERQYRPQNVPKSLPMRRRDNIDDLLAFHEGEEPETLPTSPPYFYTDEVRRAEEAQRARTAHFRGALYAGGAEREERRGIAPGEAYRVYMDDDSGTFPHDFYRVLDAAARVLGLDTGHDPELRRAFTKWRRQSDTDVLQACVLQLDEALISVLRRRRASTRRRAEAGAGLS